MKKVTVFFLLVIFLSQSTAFAQTTQQQLEALTIEITLLKRLIVEQDRRIKLLETQIKGVASGVGGSTGTGVTTGSATGWKNPDSWKRLKRGMSSQQVIGILGLPTRRELLPGTTYLTLFYEGRVSNSGHVVGKVALSDNRVYSIEAPVF